MVSSVGAGRMVIWSSFGLASATDYEAHALLQKKMHTSTQREAHVAKPQDSISVAATCQASSDFAEDFCVMGNQHLKHCVMSLADLATNAGPREGADMKASDFMWLQEPFRLWCLEYAEQTICPQAPFIIPGMYSGSQQGMTAEIGERGSGDDAEWTISAQGIWMSRDDHTQYQVTDSATGRRDGDKIIWSGFLDGYISQRKRGKGSGGQISIAKLDEEGQPIPSEAWQLNDFQGYTVCAEVTDFCKKMAPTFTEATLMKIPIRCDTFVAQADAWNNVCWAAPGVQVLDGGAGGFRPSTCVTSATQSFIGETAIAAQCCEADGTCRRTHDNVCIAGPKNDIEATTFAEASQRCSVKGLQLCKTNCRNEGCGYNKFPVWTDLPCEAECVDNNQEAKQWQHNNGFTVKMGPAKGLSGCIVPAKDWRFCQNRKIRNLCPETCKICPKAAEPKPERTESALFGRAAELHGGNDENGVEGQSQNQGIDFECELLLETTLFEKGGSGQYNGR